jgi:hypothetical protein
MPACLPTANWTTHWPFGFGRRGARRRPHRQERPARSCRYVAQAVFGRLAGYEDVNDAERLRHDPAMRWIVGGKVAHSCPASPSRNGAVRDAMAHDRKEPIGACRSFRPMDRQGSSPPSAASRHPAVDWGIAASTRYIDWVMRSLVTRSTKNRGRPAS